MFCVKLMPGKSVLNMYLVAMIVLVSVFTSNYSAAVAFNGDAMEFCYQHECHSSTTVCLREAIEQGQTIQCQKEQNGSCYIKRSYNNGSHSVTAGCASANYCDISVYTNAYGETISRTCCNTNLCNDGSDIRDPEKEYCYAYACASPPAPYCLSVEEAVQEDQTTYCKKKGNYCFSLYSKRRDGTINLRADCFDGNSCVSMDNVGEGEKYVQTCCTEDTCNNGTVTVNPDKEYCYLYNCEGTSCLSVKEAVKQGQTSLCEKPEKGCFTLQLMPQVNATNQKRYFAGCLGSPGSALGTPTCEARYEVAGDHVGSTTCCSTDRCNDGIGVKEQGKNYCHLYYCVLWNANSPPCHTLPEAIKKGLTSTCERTDKGCFVYKTNTTINAGCVGSNLGGSMDCQTADVDCCETDGCNDGAVTVNPEKEHCYLYNCEGSSCLSVKEAVKQGQTNLCEKPEKGCFTLQLRPQVNATNQKRYFAGCLGSPGSALASPTCEARYEVVGDHVGSTTCCSTDRCNDGIGVKEQGKNYCHLYYCVLWNANFPPCHTLPEAIKKGLTSNCERTDKGCFVYKTNTTINAGCVGSNQGESMDCQKTDVDCCETDGCNDDTSAGDQSRGISMVALILLALAVGDTFY